MKCIGTKNYSDGKVILFWEEEIDELIKEYHTKNNHVFKTLIFDTDVLEYIDAYMKFGKYKEVFIEDLNGILRRFGYEIVEVKE